MDNRTIKEIRAEILRRWHEAEDQLNGLYNMWDDEEDSSVYAAIRKQQGYKEALEDMMNYLDEKEV